MRYAVGIAVVIALAVGFAFFLMKEDAPGSDLPINSPAASRSQATAIMPRTPPAGWREYANTHYKFSLFYPANMKVSEFDEGGGALTVTFENVSDVQGFQIFIVPYTEDQVSEARFRRDEPSGVRNDPTAITVDGAVGAAFYSKDAALGDTREIWFIRNGFLYEATTFKSESPLLESIMQEWKSI